jgi:hypothetical protein
LWATQRLLPPVPGGEFARGLAQGRAAAVELDRRLRAELPEHFEMLDGAPDLDIVVWKVKGETAQIASERARKIFVACATRDLHLALVELPLRWFQPTGGGSSERVTCLRSVLMKPEHEAWLDRIWERLTASTAEVFSS